MKRTAYLVLSAIVFLAAAITHVASYFREMPHSLPSGAWVAAAVLCVPLVVLFLRLKNEKSSEEAWHRFWNAVIERCPRWIWGSMSIAWILAMLAFVRSIFFREPSTMVFQSAIVLIPISAAFSYAVTLSRR